MVSETGEGWTTGRTGQGAKRNSDRHLGLGISSADCAVGRMAFVALPASNRPRPFALRAPPAWSHDRIRGSNMRIWQIVVVLSLSLTFGFAQNVNIPSAEERVETLSKEQVAIYRAVIAERTKGDDSTHPARLASQTDPINPALAQNCGSGVKLPTEFSSNFVLHRIDSRVVRNLNVILVDPQVQGRICRDYELRRQVHEAIDNGFLVLSEIIFNGTHRKALVTYCWWAGQLLSNGGTVLVERVHGQWKVTKQCGEWIS